MKWFGIIFLLPLLSVSSGADLLKNCQTTQAQAAATCNCSVDSKGLPVLMTSEQSKEQLHRAVIAKCDESLMLQKNKLDQLEFCYRQHSTSPDCKTQMDSWRKDVRDNWEDMRLNLAVGRPLLLDPHAHGTTQTWFHPAPIRPFDDAPAMQRLDAKEQSAARNYFLTELGKADAQFADRKDKLKPNESLLINKLDQEPALITAMSKVRATAIGRFYVAISKSPALEFIKSVDLSKPNSPTDEEMAQAVFQTNTHMKLKKVDPKNGTAKAFKAAEEENFKECIKIRSVVEATVLDHPEMCSVAQAEVDAFDAAARTKALAITILEVGGTLVATAIACSTGVLCLPALAVVTAVASTHDISSAITRSEDANNTAITDTVIGGKAYSEQKGPSEYEAAAKANDGVRMSIAMAAGNAVGVGVKGLTKIGKIGGDGAGNALETTSKFNAPAASSSKEFAAADEAIAPSLEALPKAKQTSILAAYHEAIQRGRHSADDIAKVIKAKIEKLGACEAQK